MNKRESEIERETARWWWSGRERGPRDGDGVVERERAVRWWRMGEGGN